MAICVYVVLLASFSRGYGLTLNSNNSGIWDQRQISLWESVSEAHRQMKRFYDGRVADGFSFQVFGQVVNAMDQFATAFGQETEAAKYAKRLRWVQTYDPSWFEQMYSVGPLAKYVYEFYKEKVPFQSPGPDPWAATTICSSAEIISQQLNAPPQEDWLQRLSGSFKDAITHSASAGTMFVVQQGVAVYFAHNHGEREGLLTRRKRAMDNKNGKDVEGGLEGWAFRASFQVTNQFQDAFSDPTLQIDKSEPPLPSVDVPEGIDFCSGKTLTDMITAKTRGAGWFGFGGGGGDAPLYLPVRVDGETYMEVATERTGDSAAHQYNVRQQIHYRTKRNMDDESKTDKYVKVGSKVNGVEQTFGEQGEQVWAIVFTKEAGDVRSD